MAEISAKMCIRDRNETGVALEVGKSKQVTVVTLDGNIDLQAPYSISVSDTSKIRATSVSYTHLSLENAQRILNAAALTPVQKRRFLMYHYKGLTLREIAVYEDVGYSKIVKSIVQAEKKIYKILQQMPK